MGKLGIDQIVGVRRSSLASSLWGRGLARLRPSGSPTARRPAPGLEGNEGADEDEPPHVKFAAAGGQRASDQELCHLLCPRRRRTGPGIRPTTWLRMRGGGGPWAPTNRPFTVHVLRIGTGRCRIVRKKNELGNFIIRAQNRCLQKKY